MWEFRTPLDGSGQAFTCWAVTIVFLVHHPVWDRRLTVRGGTLSIQERLRDLRHRAYGHGIDTRPSLLPDGAPHVDSSLIQFSRCVKPPRFCPPDHRPNKNSKMRKKTSAMVIASRKCLCGGTSPDHQPQRTARSEHLRLRMPQLGLSSMPRWQHPRCPWFSRTPPCWARREAERCKPTHSIGIRRCASQTYFLKPKRQSLVGHLTQNYFKLLAWRVEQWKTFKVSSLSFVAERRRFAM